MSIELRIEMPTACHQVKKIRAFTQRNWGERRREIGRGGEEEGI